MSVKHPAPSTLNNPLGFASLYDVLFWDSEKGRYRTDIEMKRAQVRKRQAARAAEQAAEQAAVRAAIESAASVSA